MSVSGVRMPLVKNYKAGLLACAGAAAALGWIAVLTHSPSSVFATSALPTVLQPQGWFDVPAGSLSLTDFVANKTGLYFLVANAQYAEIVHTTSRGSVRDRVPIPISDTLAARHLGVDTIRVDDGGNLIVLQRNHAGVQLLYFDRSGLLTRQVHLKHALSDIVVIKGQLFGWDESSSTLWHEPAEDRLFTLAPLVPFPSAVTAVTGDHLAIVETSSARMHIVNEKGPILPPALLSAPEIQGVMHPTPPPGTFENIVYSMAAGPDGDLFFAVSPFSGDKGAVVLRFSEAGILKGRLRCSLPSFEVLRSRSNPEGRLLPSTLAIVGSELFLAANKGNKCAYYNLPNEGAAK
jgi:hypothetical protein